MSPVKQTPSKPQRVKQTRMKPLEKVQTKFEESEIAKPTNLETTHNKYAPQPKVGEPTIERPGGMVKAVGLGGLKTVTNYGDKSNV